MTRRILSLAAILVLGLLALDLGDAACDPAIAGAARPEVSPQPMGSADPCSQVCVSDCFCCSSSIPAVSLSHACELLPGAAVIQVSDAGGDSGFDLPLDHVPLSIR